MNAGVREDFVAAHAAPMAELSRNGLRPLASPAVDAAWRLTNYSGTLSADWYADTVDRLPPPEYYVELAGMVDLTA